MAPTLKQSYAYADLLIRFYAHLPDQYLYVLLSPVETISYYPLNTCNHSTRNIGAHSSWSSCSTHVDTSNSPTLEWSCPSSDCSVRKSAVTKSFCKFWAAFLCIPTPQNRYIHIWALLLSSDLHLWQRLQTYWFCALRPLISTSMHSIKLCCRVLEDLCYNGVS